MILLLHSRFHYQVDHPLLLWGGDNGLCKLHVSSVLQFVPFKKCWLRCGKVCFAASMCVNKGMKGTYIYTFTQNIPGGLNQKLILVVFEQGGSRIRSLGCVCV